METFTKLGQCIEYTYRTREAWVEERRRMAKGDKSNCAIHYVVQHILEARGESFPIRHLDDEHVTELMHELEDEHDWSPRTTNKIPTYLGTVLRHCWEKRKIKELPYRRYDKRKVGERRIHWFTTDDVENMYFTALETFRRTDVAENILVAAYCGARQTEILKLTTKDVDLARRLFHFGGRPDGHVTKAKNWREVPIADRIFDIVARRCQENPKGRLFSDFRSAKQLRDQYNRVRDYLKFEPHYVYHVLRHSFATWQNDLGTPIATIQALLGHKEIESTMIYLNVSSKAKQEAVDRMNTYQSVSTSTPEPKPQAGATEAVDPQMWAKFLEFQAFQQNLQMVQMGALQPV